MKLFFSTLPRRSGSPAYDPREADKWKSPVPPTKTPASMPDMYTRAMFGFALALRWRNPSFSSSPPALIVNGHAVKVGNWAIGLDLDGMADRQFGRYANCSPISRCLNCSPVCSRETPAVDLSIRSGGCPALWVETEDLFGHRPRISVRSFVPGLPASSDLWLPTMCPVKGRLQLVAVNGTRVAIPEADGTLTIHAGNFNVESMMMAHTMFGQAWKALMPTSTMIAGADLSPLEAMAGSVS